MELQTDGTMVHWFAAMVEGTYKLEGTQLIESFREGPAASATAFEIRFEGPELIQKDAASGAESRMTRVGPPGAQGASLVGVWSFKHDAGGTGYMMFTADGRWIFRLPIRADRGRWSASGDTVTMGLTTPGAAFTYQLQGNQLVLTDDQGKRKEFVRAELTAYQYK